MAGAYTHLLVCDHGKTKRGVLGVKLWQLLNRHNRFLFLGSVSPDLPYLSFKTGEVNWADIMHYEKTNSTFEKAFDSLKVSWANKTEADEVKLVWLLGYVSHMVADATVHPVVQATVGPYEDHTDEHRDCEMVQDSIMFNIKKDGADIRYAEFADMVRFCKASPHFAELMRFWKGILTANYSDKNEEAHPKLWFNTFSQAIDAADANSVFVGLFRHLGLGESYLYKTVDEIMTGHAAKYQNYFKSVKLPDGSLASFEKVFDKTLINITEAWKQIYEGLTLSKPVTVVKAWNLDTGVDMQSSNHEVTYWV